MNIFEFKDYKVFVRKELKSRPKAGHGQFLKIARTLGVHTTMVTHVFRGELHLNPEQSIGLADYFGLNELETEYFMMLVQFARAGNRRTKQYFETRISSLREKAQILHTRLEMKNSLDEKDQAVFYSSWLYSAIRLLSAIPKFQSRSAIAEELNLPLAKINRALEFLLSRGLCTERESKIEYGSVRTYVNHDSPLVVRHHVNWRMKAMEQLDRLPTSELAFTNPVVINEKDYVKIREEIIQLIERFKNISEPSPSVALYCLNIDWLKIRR
jgi:uncharacterized protein (TIGR02147 family)